MGKYDGWAGYIDINTGDIRPNGIFQEASYLGIYVSVAYVQAFKEERIKRMLLYAISMLMTTSVVAIVILYYNNCFCINYEKANRLVFKND